MLLMTFMMMTPLVDLDRRTEVGRHVAGSNGRGDRLSVRMDFAGRRCDGHATKPLEPGANGGRLRRNPRAAMNARKAVRVELHTH